MTSLTLVPRIRPGVRRPNSALYNHTDIEYFIRVRSPTAEEFFTVPMCLDGIRANDALILERTLLAMEDRGFNRTFAMEFAQWRTLRNVILATLWFYGNNSQVDNRTRRQYRARVVAATRYARGRILEDCWACLTVLVTWAQPYMPLAAYRPGMVSPREAKAAAGWVLRRPHEHSRAIQCPWTAPGLAGELDVEEALAGNVYQDDDPREDGDLRLDDDTLQFIALNVEDGIATSLFRS